MDEHKTTIFCIDCGRSLRVPVNRGAIRVTCPACKHKFDWSSGGHAQLDGAQVRQSLPTHKGQSPSIATTEKRRIPFRCAVTGRKFSAIFVRTNSREKFKIVEMAKAATIHDDATITDHNKRHDETRGPQQHTETFRDNDFDFATWHCPYCGLNKKEQVSSIFVQCGSCREYVCGGRVRIEGTREQKQIFSCHDGCGRVSVIEGLIESYDGSNVKPQSGISPKPQLGHSSADRNNQRLTSGDKLQPNTLKDGTPACDQPRTLPPKKG